MGRTFICAATYAC